MIPLPDKPTDCIRLADWMELSALLAPDGDVSKEQLDSAVRTAAVFPVENEDGEVEALCLDVFHELEARQRAADEAYPFNVNLPVLTRRTNWDEQPVYAFCLCLSYFGDVDNKKTKVHPRRWFESIARDAAARYLGGKAVRFASPRAKEELPIQFGRAITKLCQELLLEGDGFSNKGLPYPKDGGVDIVAWKHFPDRLSGKLILFGNCATEQNWTGPKKTELTPEPFCEEWMCDIPASKILRSLFVPHRCEQKAFKSYTRRSGMIFDRCRIAYWFHHGGAGANAAIVNAGVNLNQLLKWIKMSMEMAKL